MSSFLNKFKQSQESQIQPPVGVNPQFSSFAQNQTNAYNNSEIQYKSKKLKKQTKGQPGGGWADDDDDQQDNTLVKACNQPKFKNNQSKTNQTTQHSYQLLTPIELENLEINFEKKLVNDLIQPGGARVKPTDKVLQQFKDSCASQNQTYVIGSLLLNILQEDDREWIMKIKSLYGIEYLYKNEPRFAKYFKFNIEILQSISFEGQGSDQLNSTLQMFLNHIQGIQQENIIQEKLEILTLQDDRPQVQNEKIDLLGQIDQPQKKQNAFAFISKDQKTSNQQKQQQPELQKNTLGFQKSQKTNDLSELIDIQQQQVEINQNNEDKKKSAFGFLKKPDNKQNQNVEQDDNQPKQNQKKSAFNFVKKKEEKEDILNLNEPDQNQQKSSFNFMHKKDEKSDFLSINDQQPVSSQKKSAFNFVKKKEEETVQNSNLSELNSIDFSTNIYGQANNQFNMQAQQNNQQNFQQNQQIYMPQQMYPQQQIYNPYQQNQFQQQPMFQINQQFYPQNPMMNHNYFQNQHINNISPYNNNSMEPVKLEKPVDENKKKKNIDESKFDFIQL